MREREVTRVIAGRLHEEGVFNLQVRYGQERGPDIEAELPSSHRSLFIEVKGSSRNPEVDLGTALYQVLTRRDGRAVCGITLSWAGRYETLVRRVLSGIQRLGLHVLLVRNRDVWRLSPGARGFFPSKADSLTDALEGTHGRADQAAAY